MHTGILLAVEAESPEDAIAVAADFAQHVEWSDWNEHSGRWFDEMKGGVLRYTDDPELFLKKVADFQESTEVSIKETVEQVGHLTIEELLTENRYNFYPFGENKIDTSGWSEEEKQILMNDSFALYRAIKGMKIAYGEFTPDTHFWDVPGGLRTSYFLNERIKENPEKQFIVMYDFHF